MTLRHTFQRPHPQRRVDRPSHKTGLTSLLATGLLLAGAGGSAAQEGAVAPVVVAERAFAADSQPLGITGSFTKWSVPDAVVISEGRAQTVREAYPPDQPRPADEALLQWWPTFAGMARSEDMGFTTGAVAVNGRRSGHYFTIWRRQPDGAWRWIYDGGSNADPASAPGPEGEPRMLATSAFGSTSAAAALADVAEAEASLAVAAATDQAAAHLAVLGPDSRLYVERRAPAEGREAFAEALSDWPPTIAFEPMLGGAASDAGDMVWTFGAATWSREGRRQAGHYVRLWQKQASGWRLIVAQLTPGPTPAV